MKDFGLTRRIAFLLYCVSIVVFVGIFLKAILSSVMGFEYTDTDKITEMLGLVSILLLAIASMMFQRMLRDYIQNG